MEGSIDTARHLIACNMVDGAPIAKVLTRMCDELDTQRRAVDALTEQVSDLQERLDEVGERAGMAQEIQI